MRAFVGLCVCVVDCLWLFVGLLVCVWLFVFVLVVTVVVVL